MSQPSGARPDGSGRAAGVAAIILAAGRGTRFGAEPKMLALLDGTPLLSRVAAAALASRASPVIVVTGHGGERVEEVLAGRAVTIVRNPDHADGLSTSLRAGFAALPATAEAAIVLLGDMPAVGAGLIDRLIAAWEEAGRPPALVPTYRSRRGNPVVLSRRLAPEIAVLTGDVGAGPLLRARPDVVEIAIEDAAVTLDIDTAEALVLLQASTTPSSTAA